MNCTYHVHTLYKAKFNFNFIMHNTIKLLSFNFNHAFCLSVSQSVVQFVSGWVGHSVCLSVTQNNLTVMGSQNSGVASVQRLFVGLDLGRLLGVLSAYYDSRFKILFICLFT